MSKRGTIVRVRKLLGVDDQSDICYFSTIKQQLLQKARKAISINSRYFYSFSAFLSLKLLQFSPNGLAYLAIRAFQQVFIHATFQQVNLSNEYS